MTTVGVVGLGRMGVPMAVNLAGAGFDVALWNRSSAKAEELATSIDATVCDTPSDLAENCDIVITMLADDAASEDVFYSPAGLFAAAGGAHHIVSMGTHSPDHIRELASRSTGPVIIDAPVSGSIAAATSAQLLIMAGATQKDIEPVQSVFDAIGRETICFGSVGAGASMKLVVNMLIHGLNQTVAEALFLAESAGIDVDSAFHAIENSAAAAPMLGYRKQNYLDEGGTPVSFALSLAKKDVGLAIELATNHGIALPQTALNLAELVDAERAGFGERDMAAIISYLRGER